MADSVELPARLGILPFRNKVLLPGAIIRIRCTSPSSVKLVEQELWQREEKGLIGILPVRDAAESKMVAPVVYPTADSGSSSMKNQMVSSDSPKIDGKNPQEVIHWHSRGVAARALHLSRGVEKPSGRVTYTVVLEGLCRFNVQELSTRGTYYTARISPLDMTKSEMEPDSIYGTVNYRDQSIAGIPMLTDPFELEPKTSKTLSASLTGVTMAVGSIGWGEFLNDRTAGSVVFKLDITSVIKFEVYSWDSKKHKMHARCDVGVGPNGFILDTYKHRRCPVYFT